MELEHVNVIAFTLCWQIGASNGFMPSIAAQNCRHRYAAVQVRSV